VDISEYIESSVALPISSGVAPPENRNTSLLLFLGNALGDRVKVLRGRVTVRKKGRVRGRDGDLVRRSMGGRVGDSVGEVICEGLGCVISGGKKISLDRPPSFNRLYVLYLKLFDK